MLTDDLNYQRFLHFHNSNPEVFNILKDVSLDVKKKIPKVGIAFIVERARNKYKNSFAVNNTFRAYYARKLMKEVPELKDFFTLRIQTKKKSILKELASQREYSQKQTLLQKVSRWFNGHFNR